MFPSQEVVRDVPSLEPRRIALPLPGHEVSRASPQYKRMLEKLNDEVELYKLRVKHYHMSPAQFRRRTSVLGLPGEIYDKYDKIFRICRVCSTSVPTPPRAARVAGLRASCTRAEVRGTTVYASDTLPLGDIEGISTRQTSEMSARKHCKCFR